TAIQRDIKPACSASLRCCHNPSSKQKPVSAGVCDVILPELLCSELQNDFTNAPETCELEKQQLCNGEPLHQNRFSSQQLWTCGDR
ncbi:hypothetical protein M9458_017866, partial [Cirrhinus mrigala]